MGPGADQPVAVEEVNNGKKRSRKWVLAVASFVVVTIFAVFGLLTLAKDAGDFALIVGVWAGSDTTILGLYGAVNVIEKRGGA